MNIQPSSRTLRRPQVATVKTSSPQNPPEKPETPPCGHEHPGFFEKAGALLATGARNTLQEGMLAAKNDPALAMRMAATALSDTLLKKVNDPVVKGFDKTIVPVMRFALLGGNVVRAKSTFSNPASSKLEKVLDAGVVASDLVGAVGGIAMLTSSRFAGIGETLMGFSYAVDAVSHAYRGLDHAGKRLNYWMNKNKANPE